MMTFPFDNDDDIMMMMMTWPFGLRPKRIRIVRGGQFFFFRGPLCNSMNPLLCFIYKMYVKRYVFKLEDSIK